MPIFKGKVDRIDFLDRVETILTETRTRCFSGARRTDPKGKKIGLGFLFNGFISLWMFPKFLRRRDREIPRVSLVPVLGFFYFGSVN